MRSTTIKPIALELNARSPHFHRFNRNDGRRAALEPTKGTPHSIMKLSVCFETLSISILPKSRDMLFEVGESQSPTNSLQPFPRFPKLSGGHSFVALSFVGVDTSLFSIHPVKCGGFPTMREQAYIVEKIERSRKCNQLRSGLSGSFRAYAISYRFHREARTRGLRKAVNFRTGVFR